MAFQLPKALVSRAFEWAIATALAFALFAYGRAILPRHRLHVFVIGLLGAAALSAAFAVDPYVAVYGDAENYQGLVFMADMTLLYVAIAVGVRRERDVLILLGTALTAGAATVAYGLAQALGWDPFAWAVDPRSRPFATFGNPDHFGHFLSVFFGLALGLTIASGSARARVAAVVGLAGAIAMSAIVATRATLLGVTAALIAAALARRATTRSLILGGAVAVVVALGVVLTPLGQRLTSAAGLSDRVSLYQIALRATLARPVLGYGPDNFRAAFAANRTAESLPLLGPGPQSTAHDWVLDASATTGVLGLLALLALVTVGTVELWHLAHERPGIGAPLLLGWVAYWADGLVAASSMAAVWLPPVALGSAVALRGSRDVERAPRTVARWAAVVLTLVAILGAATGARAFQANRDAWASEEATHFGDRDAAITFADRAAARDGGRADNWNRLGLALEAARRGEAAADAYREAARREPYEAVYWANLARAIARDAGSDAAKREEAIAAAREAASVDPNTPIGHVVLAEIALSFGRCDLARAEAARAIALEGGHEDLAQRAAACR